MTESDYLSIIKERLGSYRFTHSLAVAKSSAELARRFQASESKAYTAGLLHDCMKDTSNKDLLEFFSKYSIELSDIEKASPQLWHAIAGECFSREVLGVRDDEILAAIRYHTTGRADMGLLEKIVFVADFISEDREYKGVERMREKAKHSLELAMTEGFQFTMTQLLADEKLIHPDMLSGYNKLVIKKG